MTAADDVFHDALDRLAGTGYEFEGYLSNHGPMGCDALIELGAADAVPRWVDQYRQRLDVEPEANSPIDADGDAWQQALGDMSRVADWTVMFDRALAEEPWEDVLARWWPRLLPGLVAAATHGVIRTAHAVRGISRAGSFDARLRTELAHGLGYWAARFVKLPAPRPGLAGHQSISQVIEALAALNPGIGSDEPGITARLVLVGQVESYAGILDTTYAADASDQVPAELTGLTASAARAFVVHPGPKIPLVHAVTAPAAVKLVLPHLPRSLWPESLAYSLQVSSAIVTMFSADESNPAPVQAPEVGDLVDRVVAHGDEHVIKMTEACLREYAINPDPYYLLAADAAVRGIDPLT